MHALSAESLQTWAILLSTGVDPFRTIIVQQSRVPELTELMWILGTATTLVFFEYFLVKVAFTGSEKKMRNKCFFEIFEACK
uniref:Uncharacterized protein n=1 Tax=Meloidogyne enterolobii TaxID=390850 RepID=A0A6V7UB62_MELEN|nr:unnamed protein product [Meloidogyne enterolobii]